MRKNPFNAKDFLKKAIPSVQVCVDMALEGYNKKPNNEGYWWVKSYASGGEIQIDVLEIDWKSLLDARGDLSRALPMFMPEGGILCPAGEFVMGSPRDTYRDYENEGLLHATIEKPFALGRFPVSQDLHERVMGWNPSKACREFGWEDPTLPVRGVTWMDTVRFCNRLSSILGLDPVYSAGKLGERDRVKADFDKNGFRLPTEAEWEYAARSGGDAFVYAGSDDPTEVAWFAENSRQCLGYPTTKKPNRWGFFGMSGNVFEWCQDRYCDYECKTGLFESSHRVMRGGSYKSPRRAIRVAARDSAAPSYSSPLTGFRLCRTISEKK